MNKRIIQTLAALTPIVAPAHAHVVVADRIIAVDEIVVRNIVVGESCEGVPTTGLTIEVPRAITFLVPLEKNGWVVRSRSDNLPDGIRSIVTWTGGTLAIGTAGAFPVMLKASSAVGPVYLPITQHCGSKTVEWRQLPVAGQTAKLPYPAPSFLIR